MIDDVTDGNEQDRDGRTALHRAVVARDAALVQHLISAGTDPRIADQSGYTPLHFAAQEQMADAVATLVSAGAEVDARDHWGNTPLFRAVFNSRGDGATIRALRDAGADADIANDSGVSPRDLAGRIANYSVTQFL